MSPKRTLGCLPEEVFCLTNTFSEWLSAAGLLAERGQLPAQICPDLPIAAQTVGRLIQGRKIGHVKKKNPGMTSGGGFLPEKRISWVVECYRIAG